MELEELMGKMQTSPNKKLWGLVVYQMVGENCLNGLWTNSDSKHSSSFMNEIARRTEQSAEENKDDLLAGEYIVAYIDKQVGHDKAFTGKLTIKNLSGVYEIEWKKINHNGNNNYDGFTGVGMKTGEKQLTVIYWISKK